MIRPDGCAGLQHRRTVLLESPAHCPCRAGLRAVHFDTHLLAFEHHVQEMAGEAAALQPRISPDFDQIRHELREMRWPFNRSGLDAETLGFAVIVQAFVSIIGLVLQHLCGRAQRPLDRLCHVSSVLIVSYLSCSGKFWGRAMNPVWLAVVRSIPDSSNW